MKISTIGLSSIISFSRPDAEDWMSAKVSVTVPNFEGAFACTIQVVELEELVNILSVMKNSVGSECEVSWSNMEDNIELSFKLDTLGAVEGNYRFS